MGESRWIRFLAAWVAVPVAAITAWPASALAATSVIEVHDNFFAPGQVDVTIGDTVRWTFASNESDHTVTLVPAAGGAAVVDEPVGPGDAPIDYVTQAPGRYTLLCQIHSPMRGRVDVLAATGPSPPVTAASLAPATPGPGGTYGGPVALTLAASDDSGVESTDLRINGGAFQNYSGARTFATEGAYTVEYRSTDIAGNAETLHSVGFAIDDASAPATTHTLAGVPGTSANFAGAVTVSLGAADAGGLGVATTEYRVDGGAFAPYGSPFSVGGAGAHLVEYRSTDVAGNVEPIRSASFGIDAPATAPSLRLAAPAAKVKAKALVRGLAVGVACVGTPAGEVELAPNAAGARKLGLKPGKPLASGAVHACDGGSASAELHPGRKAAKALAEPPAPSAQPSRFVRARSATAPS